MREMGRRSEPAEHPFKAMPADEGAPASARATAMVSPSWKTLRGQPIILVTRTGQRDVVTAACQSRLDLGLRPGMAAAHARALVTDLEVRDAEPDADQALLERLALHAVAHWTPTASVAGADGLWLDLSGAAHLFGGEEHFCRRLLGFMRRLGFTATIAIAGTPGAAHALARYGGNAVTICRLAAKHRRSPSCRSRRFGWNRRRSRRPRRFGLERVADLYPMPRGPLARGSGCKTVERLDQARGAIARADRARRAVRSANGRTTRCSSRSARRTPLCRSSAILVDDMVGLLQARGLGAAHRVLTCCVSMGAAAGRHRHRAGDAGRKHLKRMFAMRVERSIPVSASRR